MTIEQITEHLNREDKYFAEHDGNGDTRIFLGQSFNNSVSASELGKETYEEMEEELLKYEINGEGYQIYAWNDVSGFDYWEGDYNYIMVTANIINPEKVDVNQLEYDLVECYNHFEQYIYQ